MQISHSPILITGGAGYIGSHTVWALKDAGYSCVVFDDLSTGNAKLVPPEFPLIVADLADLNTLRKTIEDYQIQSVIHFAARILVGESMENPALYYRNNTVNTLQLVQLAVEYQFKAFVFSSTAAVYGQPSTQGLIDEETPTHPINPYGSSKRMSEQILMDLSRVSGLPYVILRYFNVAGNDPLLRAGRPQPHSTHLVPRACQAALGQLPHLEIFGEDYPTPDGTCIRDYVHVVDLAQAHLVALQHLLAGKESTICNCGYGHGFSVREMIEAVKKIAEKDFAVDVKPRRPGDPASLVASTQKIQNQLHWQPQYDSLEPIIRSALEWEAWRENHLTFLSLK